MPPSTPTSSDPVLSAALEDAEGRALVEDIIERKRLTNIRERFFQQMVWGDVQTDGHGNVIPRELPEYWQHLKAAALAGGGVEYTRNYNKPATLRVGGKASGKVSAQIEGTREAIGWLDEHVRFLVEQYRDPYEGVREVVERERRDLTPVALTVPAVGPVRWAVAP